MNKFYKGLIGGVILALVLVVTKNSEQEIFIKKEHSYDKSVKETTIVTPKQVIEAAEAMNGLDKFSSVMSEFKNLDSKIIKGEEDVYLLEDLYLNEEMVGVVSQFLLEIPEEDFSTGDLIGRESSVNFLLSGVELDNKNQNILRAVKKVILSLIKVKTKRNNQKVINGDILDLISGLNQANPGLVNEMVVTNAKLKRYYEYMLSMEEIIKKGEQS